MTDQPLDATVEIVESPFRITRLNGLLPDGRAYLATWVSVKLTLREMRDDNGQIVKLKTPKIEHRQELVLVTREPDGLLAFWGSLGNPIPAEWDLQLRYQPPAGSLLSPRAVRALRPETPDDEGRFRASISVDAPDIFRRLVATFDRFLDLSFGIAGQHELAELLAVYVMATWLSDAFAAFPYLWPNGDKGTGKTKTLSLVARTSYLGQVILAGGTYAALRDLAEYGATLCFDDAENLSDPARSDPDKRALLLAGNRKGAYVPVKEPEGKNGWRIRNISAYAPKVFSAIRLPDPVLGRRTIVLPLVRSADPGRANHDIEEDTYWPCDRRQLLDDLWLFGLSYLPAARALYDAVLSNDLVGPGFEPWRPLIATAQLLDRLGVVGLTARIQSLARDYQSERVDFEYPDATRIAVLAITELAIAGLSDVRTLADVSDVCFQTGWESREDLRESVTFTASDVAARMNRIAEDEGIVESGDEYTNAKKIGRVLDRLRIKKDRAPTKQRTKQRIILRADAFKLFQAYAASDIAQPQVPENETSKTSKNGHRSDEEFAHVIWCAECRTPLTSATERKTFLCDACREKVVA